MNTFFRWMKWIFDGKPMVTYNGFNCGCCGKWITQKIEIPEYKSCGRWWDTIDLCNRCANVKQDCTTTSKQGQIL